MARGGSNVKRREIQGDPVYGSILVSKFINRLMHDGKKTVAQRVVYDALEILKKEGNPVALILCPFFFLPLLINWFNVGIVSYFTKTAVD